MTDTEFALLMELIHSGKGFMEASRIVERERNKLGTFSPGIPQFEQKPVDQNLRVLVEKWDRV